MDSSRRAVEAYWRSRMVDGVTADEDKVAPVYKLEEVCELLRTSHVSIVKEVSDYILKRLDHKSPIVKQKALRLIKYAVGKSGTEFRREMQRHSAAMRQLFHYKGQLDPLKADALNKAVRDTAHEAISAIFASEDSKVATPAEGINKRIQGFGNTNFEMPTEEKKSFLSEVVGLGSASIKQGLSTIAAAHSTRKTDIGSYKSPTLRRSLTTEIDSRDYEGDSHQRESWVSSGVSKNAASGTWTSDPRSSLTTTAASEDSGSSHTGVKTREERLLETVVTSGGVRLQPTRDVIHAFLTEASKLDAISMSRALEMKLQSHLWQVRMKAICVLESILRKKDDGIFSIIASYFSENNDAVVKCSELPQVSLREKANKVLSLLDGDQASVAKGLTEEPSDAKEQPVPVVKMPDLIDTGDPDDYGCEASTHNLVDQRIENLTSTGSLVDDLFGSGPIDTQSTTGNEGQPDPFADVSFHVAGDKEPGDIFSGLKIDDKRSDVDRNVPAAKNSEYFDFFSDNSEQLLDGTGTGNGNMNGLMADLSLNGMAPEHKHFGAPRAAAFSGATILDGSSQPGQLPAYGTLNGLLSSNTYPLASMQYNMPPNIMLNQAFAAQPMNYAAMGAFFAQQQLQLQNLGSLNSGFGHAAGNFNEGASALPDIFHRSNNPVQSQGMMMNSSKKEETKAFDFIADHVSAARDSKRVL